MRALTAVGIKTGKGLIQTARPQLSTDDPISPHPTKTTTRLVRQGDAEALPFKTDTFDRYVSAGSIEYWPDPQRGICEAYR